MITEPWVSLEDIAKHLGGHAPAARWAAAPFPTSPRCTGSYGRAFQVSKVLPDEFLHTFEKQTAALPKSTEAERLVVQPVGQDLFRQGLPP